MRTHYEVLGVERNASAESIKTAYRTLARTLHPDRGGDPYAFRAATAAYETLADPSRRRAYDDSLIEVAPSAASAEAWRAIEDIFGPIDTEMAQDLVEAAFGKMIDRAKRQVSSRIREAAARATKGRRR